MIELYQLLFEKWLHPSFYRILRRTAFSFLLSISAACGNLFCLPQNPSETPNASIFQTGPKLLS
jgi:hypothetical protein